MLLWVTDGLEKGRLIKVPSPAALAEAPSLPSRTPNPFASKRLSSS